MKEVPDNSVDLILTDPPYGLSFMGKNWDHGVPGVPFWVQALRVAKPGAYLMAFGGTRTYHRLAVAIEDAGWEIRDTLAWVYGSGFPKSHDISKAVDKMNGIPISNDGYIPNLKNNTHGNGWGGGHKTNITAPATPAAKEWEGWGTALKPAFEPIVLARKPFKGTVATNVLEWGTGGLNIDACRVGTSNTDNENKGRFPANFINDGSDEVIALFPGVKSGGKNQNDKANADGLFGYGGKVKYDTLPSNGSAARFFYCAKASSSERGEGNTHPTVKPAALMEYLLKLASREGATVLDPFMGSGTTGIACINTGRKFIGIEKEEEYYRIAEKRINEAEAQRKL